MRRLPCCSCRSRQLRTNLKLGDGVCSAWQHARGLRVGLVALPAVLQLRVHLLALGHRRFGLLSAPLAGNDRARTRGEGLRAALDEAGLTLDDRCVQYAPIALQAAREAMHKLLALPDPPTAVVATNDVFAVGAMLACREAGVRVPQDISITGVDNTDLGATQTPGLTSVSTPIVDVGHAAADQLVARLEGQPYEAFQVFPADIVHRGTTAPPRVGALRR